MSCFVCLFRFSVFRIRFALDADIPSAKGEKSNRYHHLDRQNQKKK